MVDNPIKVTGVDVFNGRLFGTLEGNFSDERLLIDQIKSVDDGFILTSENDTFSIDNASMKTLLNISAAQPQDWGNSEILYLGKKNGENSILVIPRKLISTPEMYNTLSKTIGFHTISALYNTMSLDDLQEVVTLNQSMYSFILISALVSRDEKIRESAKYLLKGNKYSNIFSHSCHLSFVRQFMVDVCSGVPGEQLAEKAPYEEIVDILSKSLSSPFNGYPAGFGAVFTMALDGDMSALKAITGSVFLGNVLKWLGPEDPENESYMLRIANPISLIIDFMSDHTDMNHISKEKLVATIPTELLKDESIFTMAELNKALGLVDKAIKIYKINKRRVNISEIVDDNELAIKTEKELSCLCFIIVNYIKCSLLELDRFITDGKTFIEDERVDMYSNLSHKIIHMLWENMPNAEDDEDDEDDESDGE